LDDKSRNVIAGAAIGACLGAVVGWAVARRGQGGGENAVVEVDRGRAFSLLWAVIGVVRLVMELDTAAE
jgi:uncharacterized membrane protein